MEANTRTATTLLSAIFLILTAAFPAVLGETSGPAHSPSAALSPGSSDGTAIDQGIAYVLMLVALVLTYIIH